MIRAYRLTVSIVIHAEMPDGANPVVELLPLGADLDLLDTAIDAIHTALNETEPADLEEIDANENAEADVDLTEYWKGE